MNNKQQDPYESDPSFNPNKTQDDYYKEGVENRKVGNLAIKNPYPFNSDPYWAFDKGYQDQDIKMLQTGLEPLPLASQAGSNQTNLVKLGGDPTKNGYDARYSLLKGFHNIKNPYNEESPSYKKWYEGFFKANQEINETQA